MTRVLQLRRGSTAQNDNFTGLPGEITMDTDSKTIRVHDGETLGGFPIARKDDIKQPVDFDINTVSDDFWRNIIEKFSQTSFEERKDFSHNDSYVDAIIETNKLPKLIQVEMICKNPDAGYGVNEKVAAFGIGNRANPKPLAFINENGLNLRLMIGGEKFWVSHRDTGITTNVSENNWGVLFRVYC